MCSCRWNDIINQKTNTVCIASKSESFDILFHNNIMTALFKRRATNVHILYYLSYVFSAVHYSGLSQKNTKFKNVIIVKMIN